MPDSRKSAAPEPVGINIYRRVALLILAALVLTTIVLFALFKAKKESMMRYGLGMIIYNLEQEITQDTFLTVYQSSELIGYLQKLNHFVANQPLTRENILRYYQVSNNIKKALLDKRLTAQEMLEIRKAVWEANLDDIHAPVAVKAQPVSKPDRRGREQGSHK
jgi:c-di-GMP-related signal transduction protein